MTPVHHTHVKGYCRNHEGACSLTVLIAVAIGSIHYGIRVVRELRRCQFD
jgi:hypothetical protein